MVGATSTQITISDGFDTAIYGGNFSYVGNSVFGVWQTYAQFAGASPVLAVTGLNVDAHAAETLINTNQLQALFQIGLQGSDTITGSVGNDVILGYGGNDLIDGGGGHDIIAYHGSTSQYTFTSLGGGMLSVVDSVAGRDGAETLSHIDFLEFTDKTVIVANADNANIARLYSAALDRAPDLNGMAGWEDIFGHNISAAVKAQGVYASLAQTNDGFGTSIAGGFAQSVEFQNLYGTLTDAGFVTQVYLNVLNRTPDPTETNAWLNLMHNGGYTHDMVLVGFAESPENIAKTAADWLIQI